MSLDTGAGPEVAVDAPDVDPWTGAARTQPTTVPVPPAALAPTGPVAPRPRVTAVLVSHDGERRLARTLGAVAAQTRPPDLLVAADTGSGDRSAAMLTTATPHVLRLGRRAAFGDAVQAVVSALAARSAVREQPRPDDAPAAAPARREGEGHGLRSTEWLWLLHDGAAPSPDALERLLEAVETAPSVAVAGCKQVDWDDDQRLLDVGFTTSPLGARVTGLDPREVDQGQHDARSDVLAVSTAGMLVRRDVWEAVGGTDPLLAHARDDVDLCRRVRLAGHRVVVVPGAVVARAVAAGEATLQRSWYRADRRDALHLRLASARALAVPFLLVWTLAAAPVRAAWRLVLKQPGPAFDELVAAVAVLTRPGRWLRSRSRQHRQQKVPRRTLRPLLATRRAVVRRHRDALAAWAASTLALEARPVAGAGAAAVAPGRAEAAAAAEAAEPEAADGPAAPAGTAEPAGMLAPAGPGEQADSDTERADGTTDGTTDDVTGDDGADVDDDVAEEPAGGDGADDADPSDADHATAGVVTPADLDPDEVPSAAVTGGAGRRARGGPGLALVLLAAAGAAVAALRDVLTRDGALLSPVLLPAPDRAADLWALARTSWRPVGLGDAGTADPFTALLAGLGTVIGSPRTAVLALVVLALPLAALTAWWAAGALTRSRGVRLWAAAVWAAAPALLAAVSAGRPASVVAHVLLPVLALALGRAVTRGSVAAAAAAGLALTAVLAAAPSLAVPAAAVLVLLVALGRRRAAVLALTAVVPAVLLLPWWVAVARAPRLLLADPALPAAPGPDPAAPGWHLLLAVRTPADLVGALTPVSGATGQDAARLAAVGAALLTAPLAFAALAGLLRRRWVLALAGCLAGLAGLAAALLAERVEVAATPAGAATGWAGPGISLLTLGLLVAAVTGADGLSGPLRRAAAPALRRAVVPATGLVALVALAGPAALAAGWALDRPSGAAADRAGGGLTRGTPDVLPAIAAEEARGAAALRTLVVSGRDGDVRWTLLAATGPRTGAGSAALAEQRLGTDPQAAGTDAAVVVPVVGALLSDSGRDVRAALADLGVGSVLALGPVEDRTALALDAAPGLTRIATSSRRDLLWRVELDSSGGAPSRPSRARVVGADGATLAALPSRGADVAVDVAPGPPGRLLVLAERADPDRRATLDGRPLAAAVSEGWAQAFVLPTSGGRLVVEHDEGLVGRADPVRLVVLVLAVLVALPMPRLRRRVAVAPARPSRPVPRGVLSPTTVAPMPQVFDEEHPERTGDDPDEEAWPVTEAPRQRRSLLRRRGAAAPTAATATDDDSDDDTAADDTDGDSDDTDAGTDADTDGAEPGGDADASGAPAADDPGTRQAVR